MEFSLKAQNIVGTTKSTDDYLAITHEFDTPDEALLKKRGRLFIAINISTTGNFDLKAAAALFLESIQENYFRPNDDTPLHAIEKSLNRAYNLLLTIKSKDEKSTLGSPEANLHITFATALIWNSVLYTSYFGSPAIYLVRGTGTRNLSMNDAKLDIWTNSSILAPNDVIIIGTEEFAKAFSATEINNNLGSLSNTIATHPQKNKIATILIKTENTDKQLASSITDKLGNINIKHTISTSLWRLKGKLSDNETLSERFKLYQSKKTAPISSISSLSPTTPANVGAAKARPRRLSKARSTRHKGKRIIVGTAMLLAFGYVNVKLFNTNKDKISKDDINSRVANTERHKIKGMQTTSDGLHPRLINLSHVSRNILPISLATIQSNSLLILSNNALYKLNLETKESKEIYNKFEHAKLLSCDNKLCYIFGGKTLRVLNPETPAEVDTYILDLDGVIDIYSYSNNIYLLTFSNIYRFTLLGENPTKWLSEGENIENPVALAVDGNVYVLSNRNIYKYRNGKKQPSFEIDNSHLLNPIDISIEGNKLYALDIMKNADKYIVIYDKKTGNFMEKVKIAEKTDYETPNLYTVTKDTKPQIIFRKGNYLYKVRK